MDISKSSIVAKIRKAIDDIVPSATDNFSSDTDDELWQAVQHVVLSLLQEAPLQLLAPSSMLTHAQASGNQVTNADGSGYIKLATDYLRFVSLQLTGWARPVTVLLEPDSDEALRQASSWGRGTASKPRAMLDYDANGTLIMRYWTASKTGGAYVHTISIINYIPKPTIQGDTISCALKDETERMIIYQAAALFFEGKKEPETAEKFRNV